MLCIGMQQIKRCHFYFLGTQVADISKNSFVSPYKESPILQKLVFYTNFALSI